MNLSMKWLNEYVDMGESKNNPHEFAQRMTMSGSKVEGYEIEGADIERVVVGEVLSVVPHPNSDHMVITMVDVADAVNSERKPVQIVTGASNVTAGSFVGVALNKSKLPGGKIIKSGKLRGELSDGMLCSLSELALTQHDFPYAIEDGIFLLQEECFIGQDIQSAIGLDDIKVEFEITPNRPDCLSMIGLAREVAATYTLPFKEHTPVVKGSGGDIHSLLTVSVLNKELCPRYTARMVKNVKIAKSPRWMRERLRACGVRPINNLVDITNYVMLEYGQPLHAFDANLLTIENGVRDIVVRTAKSGEEIETLDGVLRKLNENMLLITSGDKPVAVAGVMGGQNSAIIDTTDTVVFESANFSGKSIRHTAKALGMRTDASSKYEKGLDPQNTMGAVERACELVELLGAGEIVGGIIDVDNSDKTLRKIPLDTAWINNFLCIDLSKQEMIDILTPLGFKMDNDDIIIPSYRSDMENKADVSEEIARMYGYDKIPTKALSGIAMGQLTPIQKFERSAHKALQSAGCFEVSTYSFISPKFYDNINLPTDSVLRDCAVITNPLGEDTSVMRTTTIPSMLSVLAKNYSSRNSAFYGYEIGTEYIKRGIDELPFENPQITIGIYGEKADFYKLKGIVELLLNRLNVEELDVAPEIDNKTFHPGRCAVLSRDGDKIGIMGEIHPNVLENYSISTRCYIAKLDFNKLFSNVCGDVCYKPLPKYPAITRDLSLICDDSLPIGEIQKTIKTAVGNVLEEIKLFDVYKGEQIEKDKKSVSYSIIMRSSHETLTDVEASAAMKRALKALEKINVTLRA